MEMIISNNFAELNAIDMFSIDGGAWSWKEFGKSIVGGAVGGAVTGAFAGTVTLPVIGTVSGWAGGAILGGIGGGLTYLVCGWW